MNHEPTGALEGDRVDLAREGNFSLGDVEVRPATREVAARDGQEVLEPRVMQVLVALGRQPGRVVSRDELVRRCWAGVVVGQDAVNRAIGKLRRLGEGAGAFSVDTIPRVGYRLTVAGGGAADRPPRIRRKLPALAIALPAAAVLALAAGGAWWVWPRPWVMERFQMTVSSDAVEMHPALSPSGALVAYAASADRAPRRILVRNVSGGDAAAFTDGVGDDYAPAWSPGGDRIAFLRTDTGPCRILVKPYPAGAEREVGRCATLRRSRLEWSPDGAALYFVDGPGGTGAGTAERIVRLDLVSGARVDITRPPAEASGDYEPVASPDGRSLLFARNVAGASGVHVQDLQTGAVRRITPERVATHGHNWTPDGRGVLVVPLEGDTAFWLYPLDGGEPRRLTFTSQQLGRMSRGAGPAYAVEVHKVRTSLALAPEAPGQAPELIETLNGQTSSPDMAADGRVAFVASVGGVQAIWVKPPGQPSRSITDLPNARIENVRWSPDGARLHFNGAYAGQDGFFAIAPDGSGVVRLGPRQAASPPGGISAPGFVGRLDTSDGAAPRVVVRSLSHGTIRTYPAPFVSAGRGIGLDPRTGRPIYIHSGEFDSDIALFQLARR